MESKDVMARAGHILFNEGNIHFHLEHVCIMQYEENKLSAYSLGILCFVSYDVLHLG